MDNENEIVNGAKRKKIIIAVVVIVLLIAALVGGYFTVRHFSGNDAPTKPVVNIDPNAQDEPESTTPEETGEAKKLYFPGFKSMTIPAGEKKISVNLTNPEENECYVIMRIVLLDGEETLYESQMVPAGKGVYTIELSRALEAGTYEAQLQYEPYKTDGVTRLNGANINFDLIVE